MHRQKAKEKVTIVGSGNWGSAIAKIVGRNVLSSDEFEEEVRMWVFQEQVNGKNLTDIINTQHENVKYLPVRLTQTPGLSAYNPAVRRPSLSRTNFVLAQGIKFTPNVIADPDLTNAVTGSTLLIFVLPHQFLGYATAARRCSPTIATDVSAAVTVAAALTMLRALILRPPPPPLRLPPPSVRLPPPSVRVPPPSVGLPPPSVRVPPPCVD